ncbi:nuclear transport factor 2 family protein [Kitasatospora sp. RB6PN24]|uniref:nuclear transport factor 2 family protein n=1 Tax=Kitasatospora humi TaxID=2893891 RepID=UPI001E44C53A|nr:nuclear transport factor 2 family protein [Kitasatospora humi]MCC9312452.1 nuclear transport factor 2 family protein [Kitasatospora humi]
MDETTETAPQRPAIDVAREFISAANEGDTAALERLLAPTVRIDMAGTVISGRGPVLKQFFEPWVVRVSGRYTETGVLNEADGVTVRYRFRTAAGLREELAYTYRISGGVITRIDGRFT